MAINQSDLILIDGSIGEGGGQVLRSALTLSAITSKPFYINNIRSGRVNPGLRPQHLAAVNAVSDICKAEVSGSYLGSEEVTFVPGNIRSGRYKFSIKTAGAATLVFQTIIFPLSMASSSSSIIISGGTHVPWSPAYHFLTLHWLPLLADLGLNAQLRIDSAGYYPKGGGKISGTIRQMGAIGPLELNLRGRLVSINGTSGVSNLPKSIAERQKRQAIKRLQLLSWKDRTPEIHIRTEDLKSPGKGTFLVISAEYEGGRCCFTGLGEIGKSAEGVADEVIDQLEAFMDTDGAIDPFICDQLLLPLSLATDPSYLHTSKITKHLVTNAQVIHAFTDSGIMIDGQIGQPGVVSISPDTEILRNYHTA